MAATARHTVASAAVATVAARPAEANTQPRQVEQPGAEAVENAVHIAQIPLSSGSATALPTGFRYGFCLSKFITVV